MKGAAHTGETHAISKAYLLRHRLTRRVARCLLEEPKQLDLLVSASGLTSFRADSRSRSILLSDLA